MKHLKKNSKRRTVIFDQVIDQYSFQEIVHLIYCALNNNQKLLLFALNIHILVELRKNKILKDQIEQNGVIYADGVPLLWLSALLSTPLKGRVSGTDLCDYILSHRLPTKKKIKVFFISGNETIFLLAQKKYPNTIVGGYVPPFFSSWNDELLKNIRTLILSSQANVILIGLGPLKQEEWLCQEFKDIPQLLVGMGVGSAIEILTGQKKRAPQFLQALGAEWLWRIGLEPRRLLRRYLRDGIEILSLFLRFR